LDVELVGSAVVDWQRSHCCCPASRLANQLWFLVLLGGLAHVTKPIGQFTINLMTGWPFGSFRFGILYPFAGHLLFGMIGGLLGALVVSGIRRYSQKSSQ